MERKSEKKPCGAPSPMKCLDKGTETVLHAPLHCDVTDHSESTIHVARKLTGRFCWLDGDSFVKRVVVHRRPGTRRTPKSRPSVADQRWWFT